MVEHVSLLHAEESSGYMPRNGITGCPQEVSCPVFWGTARLISKVVVPSCNPTSSGGVFLFLHILGKKSGAIDANINNRIQEIEERITDAKDTIETIDSTVKENKKCQKFVTQNIQEIQDTMRRPNLRIIGIDDNEDLQLKGPANIINKIIEENFPV